MVQEDQTELSQGYFKTREGKGFIRGVAVCLVSAALYFLVTSDIVSGNRYAHQPSKQEIRQEQVFGTQKPEIYIEYKGVRYFSHADGKEISDWVR